MVNSDSEHSHVGTFPVRGCPSRLRNAQRVNGIYSLRCTDAENLFPLKALVAVDLLPRELTDLAQRIERRMSLGFLQRKQVFLERRIVQVQDNPGI